MNPLALAVLLSLAVLTPHPVTQPAEGGAADGVFARVPVEALELTSGELPRVAATAWADGKRVVATWPYVVLDGGGEVYLDLTAPEGRARSDWQVPDLRGGALALRLDAARDVTGRLFVPEEDGESMRRLDFRVPAASFSDRGHEAFLRAKATHYELLLARGLPGAAWFRHQARAARQELDEEVQAPVGVRRLGRTAAGELDDTFSLFGGGRAIAENLQLDRELPFAAEEADATVALDSIPGVETAAYDWTAEIEGLEPELDRLAQFIPADQYAAFFPSIEALVRTLDELEAEGNPILSLAEGRAESARTRERYQRQLLLPFDDPDSELRKIPITQIAITGSDPYFRTGTDVTVLFDTEDPMALVTFLRGQIARARDENPGAVVDYQGDGQGFQESVITPDRSVCCQVMAGMVGPVVVTNSPFEDRSHASIWGVDQVGFLAQAPEYVYFRHRYPRGTEGEEGLLVLTDATIRRWAGPRWRIGASRRTQAAAWLADAQCSKLAFDAGDPNATLPGGLPDGSAIQWGDDGARSEKWGTTAFLTPIVELDLERVTPAEEQAYDRFRRRYQAGWRAWFDPIAVSLVRRGNVLEADLTVRPLIAGSDYRGWMDTVGGSKLAAGAGDPHEGSLVHFAMALDTRAEPVQFANSLLAGSGPDPLQDVLGWIGGGMGLYLEPDPEFFDGWRQALDDDEEEIWVDEHISEFPLALHVESKSPVKLALFMTSFRAFVEQSAPGLLSWHTHQRGERALVEITAAFGDTAFSLWYATLPEALIVTLREDVLLRAIERVEARRGEAAAEPRPWQGESLALRLDGAFLDVLRDLTREDSLLASQSTTWSVLPILREYRRLAPDRDPFALHEALFGVRLADPAGGAYAWTEAWATHASTLYGHPGAPVEGPYWPAALERLDEADLGVTFEQDGLRAHGVLRRE